MTELLDGKTLGPAAQPQTPHICDAVLEQYETPRTNRIMLAIAAISLAIGLALGSGKPEEPTPEKVNAAKIHKAAGTKLDRQFRTPPNPSGGIPF